jgi:hypothetical protein
VVRGRKILERLPVSRKVLGTVDGLRRERDGLRRERDRLREQLEDERAKHLELLAGQPASGTPPAVELLRQPSFVARTETLRRVRHRSRELHGHADPIWAFNSKLAGAELARKLGIPTPDLLVPATPLADLDPPAPRCLVKPVDGAAARGIAPLVRQPDGRWLDLFELDKGPRTWEEIRTDLEAVVASGKVSRDFVVEELLVGTTETALPFDWKLLCVGGEVVLSYGRNTRNHRAPSGSRYRYFSPDWQDLGPVRTPDRIDPTLVPNHPEQLVRVAETVARALPAMFVRVDLFETPDRVVFGEITPQPGNPLYFGPELDRQIGEVWDRVEAETWRR